MASNPPSACCATGFIHEGVPTGTLTEFAGFKAYLAGDKSSKKVVVILSDVFGPVLNNTQLLADLFAKEGYFVVIPDLFGGDYVPEARDNFDFPTWLQKHTTKDVDPIVEATLKEIRKTDRTFVGSVGYCFGAKYSARFLKKGVVDAGAFAHPSFVTLEEIKAIESPLLISAAAIDTIYTTELREKTEAVILESGLRYHGTLSAGVSHGFAVRGDLNDPVAKAAKEKAFYDQLWWFSLFQ